MHENQGISTVQSHGVVNVQPWLTNIILWRMVFLSLRPIKDDLGFIL